MAGRHTANIDRQNSMLHELQAGTLATSRYQRCISFRTKQISMDAKRLKERINYGEATGFQRDIDLWGREWWYWRKVKFNDPSLWNTVKTPSHPKFITPVNYYFLVLILSIVELQELSDTQ